MSKIVMTLTNPFRPDPRVGWEAKALSEAGHQVTIIAWDREAELPAVASIAGINIIRIQDIRSTYSAGIKQSYYLPKFWRNAVEIAFQLSPDLVHCHDLDTLWIGRQVKKKINCQLIYDAHENYPAVMTLYLPAYLTTLLVHWEKWLLKSVDHTITASSWFATELIAQGVSPVTTIGNFADLKHYAAINQAQLISARAKHGLEPDEFVVAYIGGFTLDREILPLIDAVSSHPEISLLLAGDGLQRQRIESVIRDFPNVRYVGWLSSKEIPIYTKVADVIYYALKPNYPGAIYNAPNSLGNALAAGRPVLANDIGDLGDIVKRANCGLLLSDLQPATIVNALERLKSPQLRQALGENGLRLAVTECNVAHSQKQILMIYDHLLSKTYR